MTSREGRFTAVLALALAGCGEPFEVAVWAQSDGAVQWDRFYTTGRIGLAPANPFDPAQLDLNGEFRSPDGAIVRMPGFLYRPFRREWKDGREVLLRDGEDVWQVRFTPTRTGRWHWRWVVKAPQGTVETGWRLFDVHEPWRIDDPSEGFVRRSPDDLRYLRTDGGATYFASGENLAWPDARGTFAYDDWIEPLTASVGGLVGATSATFIRLWMWSQGFGLEWTDRTGGTLRSSLGDYTDRLDRAWQLDYVLALARQKGLKAMLCLQNHGAFSLVHNSEWADNPYNAANGGPLARPEDFFTDPTARALFQRRLRYIVARWGASTAILAWELFNEVDNTEQLDPEVLREWHETMAAYLRSIDPNRHLVTSSTAGFIGRLAGIDDALFQGEALDFSQLHVYGTASSAPDFTEVLPRLVRENLERYRKPVLVGEAGVDYRGPAETLARDPHFDGLHDLIMAPVFAGSFGTGMTWWWDNVIDPHDQYRLFRRPAQLRLYPLDRMALRSEGASITAAEGDHVAVEVLRNDRFAFAWIRNTDNLYPRGHDEREITSAVLVLDGVEDGTWAGFWVSPRDARWEKEVGGTASGGRLQLQVPAILMDIGLVIAKDGKGVLGDIE